MTKTQKERIWFVMRGTNIISFYGKLRFSGANCYWSDLKKIPSYCTCICQSVRLSALRLQDKNDTNQIFEPLAFFFLFLRAVQIKWVFKFNESTASTKATLAHKQQQDWKKICSKHHSSIKKWISNIIKINKKSKFNIKENSKIRQGIYSFLHNVTL